MEALYLRKKYAEYFSKHGYSQLFESSLINQGSGPYFVGSALMPNMGFFLGTKERNSDRMFTQQRVFWTRHAELVAHNPVWSIYQVMMSFYQFNKPDLQEAIRLAYGFLVGELGLEATNLYVLAENSQNIKEDLEQTDFIQENLVFWDKMLQFRADDQLQGTYLKIFLRYKHGILPIWDLIYMPQGNGTLHVDSCLLLERLSFILQEKNTWYETEVFQPLLTALEEQGGLPQEARLHHVDNQLAVVVRSIAAAVADGADVTPKGKGYVVKRLLRSLLQNMAQYDHHISLADLSNASLQCLQNVGYHYSDSTLERIYRVIREEEEAFERFQKQAQSFLLKEVQLFKQEKRRAFTTKELARWKDERGIPIETATKVLKNQGCMIVDEKTSMPETRIFLSDGYPYDRQQVITDPACWLKEMEANF